MEQTITNTVSISHFNGDEIEVAQILLQLPLLFLEENSFLRIPFSWGAKRSRSSIDVSPSPPRCSSPLPPGLLHPLPHSCNGERPAVKVESSNPVEPLSFSPSESDSRLKPSKKKSIKKKLQMKEEFIQTVLHLSENLRMLKQELPKMRTQYEMLKSTNLKLKTRLRLRRLSAIQKQKKLNRPRTSLDLSLEPRKLTIPSTAPEEKDMEEEEEGKIMTPSPLTTQLPSLAGRH